MTVSSLGKLAFHGQLWMPNIVEVGDDIRTGRTHMRRSQAREAASTRRLVSIVGSLYGGRGEGTHEGDKKLKEGCILFFGGICRRVVILQSGGRYM